MCVFTQSGPRVALPGHDMSKPHSCNQGWISKELCQNILFIHGDAAECLTQLSVFNSKLGVVQDPQSAACFADWRQQNVARYLVAPLKWTFFLRGLDSELVLQPDQLLCLCGGLAAHWGCESLGFPNKFRPMEINSTVYHCEEISKTGSPKSVFNWYLVLVPMTSHDMYIMFIEIDMDHHQALSRARAFLHVDLLNVTDTGKEKK